MDKTLLEKFKEKWLHPNVAKAVNCFLPKYFSLSNLNTP
jgi:hypothetical protein